MYRLRGLFALPIEALNLPVSGLLFLFGLYLRSLPSLFSYSNLCWLPRLLARGLHDDEYRLGRAWTRVFCYMIDQLFNRWVLLLGLLFVVAVQVIIEQDLFAIFVLRGTRLLLSPHDFFPWLFTHPFLFIRFNFLLLCFLFALLRRIVIHRIKTIHDQPLELLLNLARLLQLKLQLRYLSDVTQVMTLIRALAPALGVLSVTRFGGGWLNFICKVRPLAILG